MRLGAVVVLQEIKQPFFLESQTTERNQFYQWNMQSDYTVAPGLMQNWKEGKGIIDLSAQESILFHTLA